MTADGFRPVPAAATLLDLINKYTKEVPVSGKTKAATLAMLGRRLGSVKLNQLSPVHIQQLISDRLAEGAGGVTIGADLSYLSEILRWARFTRRLDINPDLAVEARASLKYRGIRLKSRERDREPTDAELEKLYAYWRGKKSGIPMETIVKFALATAMRQGEIFRIKIEDLDPSKPSVIIRDRKDPKEKMGNDQEVPLLPEAWEIVQRAINGRSHGRIFPFNGETVSTFFTRACKVTGIVDLRFHDLRHAATAALFRRGLQIQEVALITGHKSWQMLRRYTKIRPEDVLRKIEFSETGPEGTDETDESPQKY